MPLGLLSLAANLQIDKQYVNIYEPKIRLIKKEDYKKAAADILKNKPHLLGFSTWCITYPSSLLVAQQIKLIEPNIPIVFGGPQASILSKQTLEEFPFVDFIISGEADFTFPLFLDELIKPEPDFSQIPGLAYRDSFDIFQNKQNGAISNLDNLPMPAYHLTRQQKWLKLDVGRGCPFKCTYCSTSDFFSKKYRIKTADRIISEMKWAHENKKIKSFSFAHDMFTLNKKFIFELCNKLIEIQNTKGLTYTWTCSARIDCVNHEMLHQMQKAGCRSVFFGIESGSERIQKSISKNLDISKVYEIAEICRRIGIDMHASYIIGFPEETKNDIDKTLQSALKLAYNGVFTQISELSLLPGTPLFNKHRHKLKFDGRFSSFSRNLCGYEELKLITSYPGIFSSFYYLPVKTICRSELVFLCHIINNSNHFRNTLFLLAELIKTNLNSSNLLELYKIKYKQLTIEDREQNTIVSFWIKSLNDFILKNKNKIDSPFIHDIFAFEAFVALLKTIFSVWQLIHLQKKNTTTTNVFLIKPTPVWKILSTSYKLENIIPSENGWKQNRKGTRNGSYNYLLVAVSEVKCKQIKLSKKELFLLENLSELTFSEYLEKVKTVLDEKDVRLWLKKLEKWGVIEIIYTNDKDTK